MHRSSCRLITGCLSSTPIPLLHIEALLPPLRVTLTHQSLSFFEQALRLPSTFPIASLENSNPRTRLKKSSWRSSSRSHILTPNLHLTREPLILCPPKPPSPPHLVTQSHSTSHPHALAKTPLPSQHRSYHPPFHSISQRYLCLDRRFGTWRAGTGWCRDTHQVYKVCHCYLALLDFVSTLTFMHHCYNKNHCCDQCD